MTAEAMARVSFQELMAGAAHGGYAVGYFETWNLESLLALSLIHI